MGKPGVLERIWARIDRSLGLPHPRIRALEEEIEVLGYHADVARENILSLTRKMSEMEKALQVKNEDHS